MLPDLISVLVTVRNGGQFIREAIDSLLAQTDRAFEVVVVDDGSDDDTADIIGAQQEPRIRLIRAGRIGRAAALARAAGAARGTLIAILDADDIALPTRLEVQRHYLDQHPEVVLVGSAAIEFGVAGRAIRNVVTGPANVRRALGMYNPFYHSSIMFRRSSYEASGGYRADGGWGHDKDLVVRLAALGPIDILPTPLILYRRHSAQLTYDRDGEGMRRRKSSAIQLRAARTLHLPPLYWVVPVGGWIYARLPARLRIRRLKDFVKKGLLLALRASGIRPT